MSGTGSPVERDWFGAAVLRHYFAAALRSAVRSKFDAAVCLVGLVVGITSALLIAIYALDELSYDRWIPGHEQVVQLTMGVLGQPTTGAAPSDIGHWVRSDFPDIEGVARLFRENVTLERDGEQFAEVVTWADASFFDVLPLPVIAGDRETALARPDNIVLTRNVALRLFGRLDVIGELVSVSAHPMIVSAVIENLPSNTHLDIRVLAPSHAPFSSSAEQDRNPLEYFGSKAWLAVTYARLPAHLSAAELRRAMPAMLDRRTAPGSARRVSERFELTVRPIADIHLSSGLPSSTGIDARPIYVLAAIAALIVVAASINFVNLMTARAATRAVEVGVRKSLGASRRDLVIQYMMEAWLYVALAAIISLALIATLLLAVLNAFLLRSIELVSLFDPVVLAGLGLFLICVGLLAGTYPSLVLSRFPAVTVMRARTLRGGGLVRETLIVTQFAILIALLVGTAVISRQITFAIGEALGRYTNPIVTITTSCPAALKSELRALPEVEAVACADQLPQWGIGTATPMQRRDGEYRGGIWYTSVDFGFFELFAMNLVAGRFFVEDLGDAAPADNEWRRPEAVVLNEAAVELLELGSPAEAVGEIVAWRRLFRSPSTFTPRHDAEVIGVVQDFQTGRLTESGVRPTAFYVDPGQATVLTAKLSGRELAATLAAIRDVWKRFGEPRPIQLGFFDDTIELMYRDLIRQQRVFAVFASVAVFISFLGLLGLLVHSGERRAKEVAVRRILGGRRLDIVALLLWQFARPIVLAIAIAWPVAYFAAGAWLEGFARRVELNAMSFLLPSAATLLLTLVVVAFHASVILRRRPVGALRYE